MARLAYPPRNPSPCKAAACAKTSTNAPTAKHASKAAPPTSIRAYFQPLRAPPKSSVAPQHAALEASDSQTLLSSPPAFPCLRALPIHISPRNPPRADSCARSPSASRSPPSSPRVVAENQVRLSGLPVGPSASLPSPLRLSPPPSPLLSSPPLPPPTLQHITTDTIPGSDDEDASDASDEDDPFRPLESLLSSGSRLAPPSEASRSISPVPKEPRSTIAQFLRQDPCRPSRLNLQSLLNDAKKDRAADETLRQVADLHDDNAHADTRPGLGLVGRTSASLKESLRPLVRERLGEAISRHRREKYASSEDDKGSDQGSATQDNVFDGFGDSNEESEGLDDEECNLHKVVRAVERTDATIARPAWYFFQPLPAEPVADNPTRPQRSSFPARVAQRACGGYAMRSAADVDPYLIEVAALSGSGLPDELVQWVWEEVCSQDDLDADARAALCRALVLSGEAFVRLCNRPSSTLLQNIFEWLGATPDVRVVGPLLIVREQPGRYNSKSWDPVVAVLGLVAQMASRFSLAMLEYMGAMLLRLAADRDALVDLEMLRAFQDAIHGVAASVSDKAWDDYAHNLCAATHSSFAPAPMRLHILTALPSHLPRLHELRRRLALGFFFNDSRFARLHPDAIVSMEAVHQRLETHPGLRPGMQSVALERVDYIEFRALAGLFDIAFDTGFPSHSIDFPSSSFFTSSSCPPSCPSSPPSSSNSLSPISPFSPCTDATHPPPAAVAAFNRHVDAIASTLRLHASNVQDVGMRSLYPAEAKSEMEWVRHRVLYGVRTQKQATVNIYEGGKRDDGKQRRMEDFW